MSAFPIGSVLCLAGTVALIGCSSGAPGHAPETSGGTRASSLSGGSGAGATTGGRQSEGGASGGVSSRSGGSTVTGSSAQSSGGTSFGSSAASGGTATNGSTSSSGALSSGGSTTGGAGTSGSASAGGSGGTGGIASGGSRGGEASVSSGASGGTTASSSAGAAGGGTASSSASGGGKSSGGATTSGGGSGGTTGSGGATASGGNSASPFVLDWEDNFDSFDSAKWTLQTHSWEGNLAQFSVDNTKFQDGIASILLTRAENDTAKPYRGIEMRSLKTLTYGKISARIRFAKGPGVVSGLVAIYTPWPAGDWNEIDIEHLGKTPTAVQLNCMYYAGTPIANPTTSVKPTEDPQMVPLGFDAEAGFHQYDVEWTPAGVKFIIDGTVQRTWTAQSAKMRLPQNILFTIWASSSADWAGAISSATIPTSADIDWIKVYSWKG